MFDFVVYSATEKGRMDRRVLSGFNALNVPFCLGFFPLWKILVKVNLLDKQIFSTLTLFKLEEKLWCCNCTH